MLVPSPSLACPPARPARASVLGKEGQAKERLRMANRMRVVIGGVDTHGRTHHAAIIDQHGRLLADAEFGAHTDGYRQLLGWLRRHRRLCSVGVEGTGT